MSDSESDIEPEVNRRKILRSVGAVGGGITALGVVSERGEAKPAGDSDGKAPDVETMRDAFATHGKPILEELTSRGIIENPTPEALDIRHAALTRKDETVGHISTFRIDDETYRGIDTVVSSKTARAVVSVIPAIGTAMASISPESGEGVIIGTTDDDSVSTMNDGECEGNAYIDACGCEYGNSPCKCENSYTYYLQHWECSCGDGCTHFWQECPDSSDMTCVCYDPWCNESDCCCSADCEWYE